MPTREEFDLRERAERALRLGAADEALGLYNLLLQRVSVFEPGLYESWIEGALTACQALGRRRTAGHLLLALRRYPEAERCFDRTTDTQAWALCASRQGRWRDGALALEQAGRWVLAAAEREAAGDFPGAKLAWQKVVAHERLRGHPYEEALAWYSLARALRATSDETAAGEAFARAQTLLEALADQFESRGERERAFDCYGVLLRLGKDAGSFENLAEGYLNAIRILAADDQKFFVLQYCEDFLAEAVGRREWHAAAAVAREAAEHSRRMGLVYDRHYLGRAAELWIRAGEAAATAGLPAEVAENGLANALDAAISLQDFPLIARIYHALADLPLAPASRERYGLLARRYAGARDSPSVGPALPDRLRSASAYQDVVRQDLIEWELDGDPIAVLTQILVERTDHLRFSRLALRGLLMCEAPGFDRESARGAAELAAALGRVQLYEVLRPLERMFVAPAPETRAAVMAAAAQVFCRRSFGLVRGGLRDPEPRVQDEALRALRSLRFRDGLDPLGRLYREFRDEPVRQVILETIADIGSFEAGLFLIDVARQEMGSLRDTALRRLKGFPSPELGPVLREHAELAGGQLGDSLRALAPL